MKNDGCCHCGYITYEAEIDPEKVMICHCTDCQTLSGSAFRTVALTREARASSPQTSSRFTSRRVKMERRGRNRSARNAERRFIRPPLAIRAIRVGTTRQRDQLVPKVQLWCRSSQSWLNDLSAVPGMEKQPIFDERGGVT